MRYILASASPRRQELIRLFGLAFEIMVADVDEDQVTDPDPAVNVIRTAALKADAVADMLTEPAIIVAADTTVSLDDDMLNKPADAEEARQMLQRLCGRTHQVHTGIVVWNTGTGRRVEDVATVDVPMRNYSEAEIEAYIATGDPLDKAGSYAIQHSGFRPVKHLSSCYAAVVGLPLCHLARALRAVDVAVTAQIALACQNHLDYLCPIYPAILAQAPVVRARRTP